MQINPLKMTESEKIKLGAVTDDTRFDGLNHIPVHIEPKQMFKNCKDSEVFSKTKFEKYIVALCLNQKRNRFKEFHVKN